MIKADKTIITVCPTGSWLTKDKHPNVPLQPVEIADEVTRAWNEGASIAHIHCRDKEGNATSEPEIFAEVDRLIRERGCDIIIQHSTSPGRGPGQVVKSALKNVSENLLFGAVDTGLEAVLPNPEMASLDIGVSVLAGDPERCFLWTRAFVKKAAKVLKKQNIKAELEVYTIGGLVEVNHLVSKKLISSPYWISLCMGMERTIENVTPFSPKNMMHLVDHLPEEALFTALGIGPTETPAVIQSILLGGHARVGFEDNPYYRKGQLAKSNAELVARIARISRDLGREICSPKETRQLLGIPPLKASNF